jgi:hypothetical protein
MNKEIRVNFKGTMFHPNYITGYCMNTRASDWNQNAQDEMAKIWQMSMCLPNLKAGIIIDMVKGRRKIEYEDFTLIIHPPDEEE